MAFVYDQVTGFPIGDPDARSVLSAISHNRNAAREIQTSLDQFILSVSGFRKVYAAGENEESTEPSISASDAFLSALFAREFVGLVAENMSHQNAPCVVVGIDARPTGPAIADAMIRALLAAGATVRYLFIVAAPEIMAYTKNDRGLDGFVYVSASHNPVGHNGVKFGLNRGGVLGPEQAGTLIERIRATVGDREKLTQSIAELVDETSRVPAGTLAQIFARAAGWKHDSALSYAAFTERIAAGTDRSEEAQERLASIRNAIGRHPVGILGELNGSARGTSIDRDFLEGLGVHVALLNGKPREIVHRIVPEGESLDLARAELERLHSTDPTFTLGYVPDNDGDRGNLVYVDDRDGTVHTIAAQDVFALACVSELSWLVYTGALTFDADGHAREKIAIAVNGPTSLRIDRIADIFDAHVFRAEVGEANVVELARRLRKRGYIVRILGEGSNGGNITYPASVRDPLNTLLSTLKLLAIGNTTTGDNFDSRSNPGLFEIWCRRSGQADRFTPGCGIGEILDTLPRFVTTSAYEDRAILKIRTLNHGNLEAEYERLFPVDWHARKGELNRRFGVVSWKEIHYEGVQERQGSGRPAQGTVGRGGFKIVFKDDTGHVKAFVWMRGSGTEPVFRVMADVESSDPEDEKYLLDWHVDIVRRADETASTLESTRSAK